MIDHRPHLLPKVRSKKLMAAMAGLPCTLRIASFIPGHTCSHQSTVVGCHLPVIGKGTSTKVTDLAVAAGCFNCHALNEGVDKRINEIMDRYPAGLTMRYLNALIETHALLIQHGIIVVPDGEIV